MSAYHTTGAHSEITANAMTHEINSIPLDYVVIAVAAFFLGVWTAYTLTKGGAQSATLLTPPEEARSHRRHRISV